MNNIAARHPRAMISAAVRAASPASFAQARAREAAPRTGPASEAFPMFHRHHAMSGWADRPTTKEPEIRRQAER